MKKITLLTLLCTILTLPFAFGQNFSMGVSDGVRQSPMAVELTAPIVNAPVANNSAFNQSMAVVEITHNTSNILETGFRCNGGNNSFYRDFDLAGDFGVVEDFEVLAAQFVPWFNGGPATSMDVTLNIYSTTTGTFPGGTLTLQGTTTVSVDIADNFNLLTIPVSAIIPAGESMIYEVALINDGANDQFIVANNQPQTGPSYWSSPAGGFSCNFPIVDLAVQFGNGMSFIMNVFGEEILPPPPGQLVYCSEDMPLDFAPPLVDSASNSVMSTSNSGDTGIIGSGLGEYAISNITINSITESAQDRIYAIQTPSGTIFVLDGANGGTDGLDTAADLIFRDDSPSSITSWTGGPPSALGYVPQDGDFATAFAGEPIDGDWFLIVDSNPSNQAGGTVNSFCITFQMVVGDAPEIFCPADFTADNDEGVCGAVVNFAPAIALDTEDGTLDASNIVQTGGPATGSEFPVGDTDVTFTATDSHGNETSCAFVVTVNDVEAPVAVCQAVTVTLDVTGAASIFASDLDGGSTDNCGVDSFVASQTAFSCADVGDVTVTLEVYDVAGNMTSCEATVTVVDDTAPVIECIGEPVAIVITHNQEDLIEAGYGVACPTGDNLFARQFVMSDFGITEEFTISSGKFGVQSAEVDMDITYNIWDVSAGFPAGHPGTSTLLGSEVVTVSAGEFYVQNVTFDTPVVVPTSTTTILVEVSKDAPEAFFLGGTATKVDFSYLASVTCGVPEYTTATDIGFPDANYYMTVRGTNASSEIEPFEVDLNADGTVTILMEDLIQGIDEACDYTVTSGGDGAGACDFENPNDGTFENGYNCSSASAFQTANDLDVAAGGDFTLNQITASIFANGGIASVDVVYYDNNAGLPGTEIGSELGLTPSSQAVIGSNFGFDVNEIVLDLTPVVFTEGKYWVELSVTDGGGTGSVFWVITTSTSMGDPVANFNGGWAYPDSTMDGVVTFSGECSGGSGGGGATEIVLDCSNLGENVIDVVVTDASGNSSSCQATVIVSDVTAPVLVCGPSEDVTTVTVDFNGSSVPEGWSVSNAAGDYDWTFGASGAINAGGTIPFASNAAIFDDDDAGNGNVNNASLLTPVWDMSGTSSVTMSYDYSFNELGAGETLAVDVYDGAAWQNVVTYDVSVLTPENSGVIDGSALANADFQVRFTYDDAGSWGWNAGVDNFQIDFALPPANPRCSDCCIRRRRYGRIRCYGFLI